jgi:hypothetical protein
MIELVKEWGTSTVAFFLSFAITSGIYSPPDEECTDPIKEPTVSVSVATQK